MPSHSRTSSIAESNGQKAQLHDRVPEAHADLARALGPTAVSMSMDGNGLNADTPAAAFNRARKTWPAPANHSLLQLQRKYGNRYVQRMVQQSRKGEGESDVGSDVEQAIERSRGGGKTLGSDVRAQMESAFDADFSGVRVHNDAQSDKLNQSLSARAFTTGQDVFFRQGEYRPGTSGGRKLLAHELTHVVQQSNMQSNRSIGGLHLIQRKLFIPSIGSVLESIARPLTQEQINQIVSDELLRVLNEFRNIAVNIDGVDVTVRAAYFMNTAAGRRRRRPIRRAFRNVYRALGGQSLLRPRRGTYTPGQAVRYGKATPQDIASFINAFAASPRGNNALRSYALRQRWIPRRLRRILRRTSQLRVLGQGNLQRMLQQWVRAVGIGLDCSGFVLIALVRARELVRSQILMQNLLAPVFGHPRTPMPPPVSPVVRSAHSFGTEPRVRTPLDLRPGDVWLMNWGPRCTTRRGVRRCRNVWRHIRIVTNTRIVRDAAGNPQRVEFDTAESRSRNQVGPVARHWVTRDSNRFGLGGRFHRAR